MFKNLQEKWAKFHMNFKEYMKLRQVCKKMECEFNDAHEKITSYHWDFDTEICNVPRCIRVFYSAVPPQTDQDNYLAPGYRIDYCKEFYAHDFSPCTNHQCKFRAANHEYYDALARYVAARNCRRAFWRGNKKSKTK